MKGVITTAVRDLNDTMRAVENLRARLVELPIFIGNGSPENNVVADIGSLYLNLDGGTSTTLYVKESDSDKSSGWVAK